MNIKVKSLYNLLIPMAAILIPSYFTDLRADVGGLILRFSDVLAFSLILIFLICKRFRVVKFFLPHGFKLLLIFIFFCFLNGLFQSGLVKAFIATFQWFFILLTISVVYSISLINKKVFLDLFIKTLLLICIFSIIYHFSIGKFVHYKNLGDGKYVFSITGVFILTYLFYQFDRFYFYSLVFLYPFIILSLERKGILAFHVVLALYLIFSFPSILRYFFAILMLFVLGVALISPESISVLNISFFEYEPIEIDYLDEQKALWTSNLHRQSLLIHGWDIFVNNYVLGVGPKMLPTSMVYYYTNPILGIYTHNVFLDTLIEQGLVGFILLFLPYCFFLLKSKNLSKKQLFSFVAIYVYCFIMLFFMSGGGVSMYIFFLPLIVNHLFLLDSED